jgi:hypothetical protein
LIYHATKKPALNALLLPLREKKVCCGKQKTTGHQRTLPVFNIQKKQNRH